jgi:1D-myo-inositol 3-kinase
MPPDFLVVGHVTKDLRPGGFTIGGTATYAAATAQRLGLRAAIVTSADPDLDLASELGTVQIHRLPSPVTTSFENIYTGGHRVQYLRAVAAPLDCDATPPGWERSPIVLLGPLAQEVDPGIVGCFEHSLVGITPQGWMRAWGDDGRVRYTPWTSAPEVLRRVDVLIFSEEDVAGDQDVIQGFARLAKLMVVTSGWQGADVYQNGVVTRYPAFVTREVDPTGAGDTFATAFLVRLHETGDPAQAAVFANASASYSIEGVGIAGLPTRAQVLERMRTGTVIL